MTKPLGKMQGADAFVGYPEDVQNKAAVAHLLGCGPGVVSLLCKTGRHTPDPV